MLLLASAVGKYFLSKRFSTFSASRVLPPAKL